MLLGKIGEKYTCQKKSNTLSGIPKSQENVLNEVMEIITLTHDSHTDRAEPLHETADEEDLLSLFDQYSDLMSPNSDYQQMMLLSSMKFQ